MQQFSIKNARAVDLLDRLTRITGKGKTEIVLEALESYERGLRRNPEVERVIEFIETNIHAKTDPELLGRAPTKEEIEEMLGMP